MNSIHKIGILALLGVVSMSCGHVRADDLVLLSGKDEISFPPFEKTGLNQDGAFPAGAALEVSDVDGVDGSPFVISTVFENHEVGAFKKEIQKDLLDYQNAVLSLQIKVIHRDSDPKALTVYLRENAQAYTSFAIESPETLLSLDDKIWHTLEVHLSDGRFEATKATLDGKPVDIKVETAGNYTGAMIDSLQWTMRRGAGTSSWSIGFSDVKLKTAH